MDEKKLQIQTFFSSVEFIAAVTAHVGIDLPVTFGRVFTDRRTIRPAVTIFTAWKKETEKYGGADKKCKAHCKVGAIFRHLVKPHDSFNSWFIIFKQPVTIFAVF